jgi:hypothetical protein
VPQKINALLGKDNHKPENGMPGEVDKQGKPKPYTKASFCRALDTRPDVLNRFLKAKQMMGGAESAVYPKAYAFFEKKRIFDGKKKTVGREKVEVEYVTYFSGLWMFGLLALSHLRFIFPRLFWLGTLPIDPSRPPGYLNHWHVRMRRGGHSRKALMDGYGR